MIRALALMLIAAGAGLLWSRIATASVTGGGAPWEMDWSETTFYPDPVARSGWSLPDISLSFDSFVKATETMTDEEKASNLNAFLMMIRTAEGTADADGYRRIFGGALFDSFADHPRIVKTATFKNGLTVSSSAAGAYQFLSTTWDEAKRGAGVKDFSPASQDLAAVFLIKRRGALDDVRAGRFDEAVRKLAKEWASLPGSPYGQPTISEARARDIYAGAGGGFA